MHKVKERLASMERKHLIAACAIVLVLTAAIITITLVLVMNTQSAAPNAANITISGEVTCLPHKNSNGPQTLECAYGLRSDDNRYYGLQDAPVAATNKIGDRVEVRGVLSTANDSVYDIVGNIKVKEVKH